MALSPKKKRYLALSLLMVGLVAFGFLTVQFGAGWIAGMLATLAAYACWDLTFVCPVCGTPYLYRFNGILVIPAVFPDKCRKCGHPTGE